MRGREAYPVWREIATRWADNDAYGHVNNTVHYAWFDTAVNGWLIEAGLLDVAAGDPIGLVVETGCRYAAPLTYPEPVEIGLGVERLGTSSVTYRLGVFAKGRGARRRRKGISPTSMSGAKTAGRPGCPTHGARNWSRSA